MNRPTVSVVVATHNYGRYLAQTIESVLRQTWTDWELLLIDDGSTDDTERVARAFTRDPRVRYLPSNNLGQVRAKNLGIQLARGEFIAFLDGDDAWLPTKLERQVRLARSAPEVGVVCCRRSLIDADGGLLESEDAPFHRGQVFEKILVANFVCFSSSLARREVFERVGAFDPRLDLAVDYDLWLRVAQHYPFDYVDEPLVKYRTGHGNLSKRIVERIITVLSTMRRRLIRQDNAASLSPGVWGEAWGSTHRTMGYVKSRTGSWSSIGWLAQAARHDGAWPRSLRAIAGFAWRALTKSSRRGVTR